jgi:hypothetical protein
MSTRPPRQSSKDAQQKIRDILAWEQCPESSDAFKLAAAKMEAEFASTKRRRVTATDTASTTPTASESSSDAAGSAPSSEDDGTGCEDESHASTAAVAPEQTLETLG